MTDIVERLRKYGCDEAAGEIERLRETNNIAIRGLRDGHQEIERLRAALDKYACHTFGCAKIKNAIAKCDCGLAEIVPVAEPRWGKRIYVA